MGTLETRYKRLNWVRVTTMDDNNTNGGGPSDDISIQCLAKCAQASVILLSTQLPSTEVFFGVNINAIRNVSTHSFSV